MRRPLLLHVFALLIVTMTASIPRDALADCTFSPGTMSTKRYSLVRAFGACPDDFPAFPPTSYPNVFTPGGTDACSPPIARPVGGVSTPYYFDSPDSGCKVQEIYTQIPCAVLEPTATGVCSFPVVSVVCKGIRHSGVLIDGIGESGWKLAVTVAVSIEDPENGQMTMPDFAFTLPLSTPDVGEVFYAAITPQYLKDLLGVAGAAVPGCMSVRVLETEVRDPDGLPFADNGGSF